MNEDHIGTMLSGEVECNCGWKSGHFALALDAEKAFRQHLKEVGAV